MTSHTAAHNAAAVATSKFEMLAVVRGLRRARTRDDAEGAAAIAGPCRGEIPWRRSGAFPSAGAGLAPNAGQPSGYIVTCMRLVAACNEPNITTAPTAKLTVTAIRTRDWISWGALQSLGRRIGGRLTGEATGELLQCRNCVVISVDVT